MATDETPGIHPTADALKTVIGMRLRRLQSLFAQHWVLWFRRKGVELSSVQGGLLLLIRENPGLPQIAFARLLGIEPPSLAQLLAPLVSAGLVYRYKASHDGRASALHLSREGLHAADLVERGRVEHETHLLDALTPQERTQLLALLEKAAASAERAVIAASEAAAAPVIDPAPKSSRAEKTAARPANTEKNTP